MNSATSPLNRLHARWRAWSVTLVVVLYALTWHSLSAADVEQTGSIFGRVVDAQGAPLAGITVTILRNSSDYPVHRVHTTAADGTFMADTLVTGTYLLRFSEVDGRFLTEYFQDATTTEAARRLTVAGTNVDAGTVALQRAGVISGQLRMYDGNAPDEVTLTLEIFDNEYGYWRIYATRYHTGTVGQPLTYTFGGLGPGTYQLEGRATYRRKTFWQDYDATSSGSPTLFPVTDGEQFPSTDFAFGWAPGCGLLQVHVVDPDGAAAPDISVTAIMSTTTFGWSSTGVTGQSGADGRADLLCLESGLYTLNFRDIGDRFPEQYLGGDGWRPQTAIVFEAGDQPTAIVATLLRGGRIRGNARFYQGSLDRVYIILNSRRAGETNWTYDSNEYELLDPAAGGAFATRKLLPGEYRLQLQDVFHSSSIYEWFDDVRTDAQATTLVVAEGADTTGIEVELGLTRDSALITGTVTDRGGMPLRWIGVSAISADGEIGQSAQTDANGSYWLPMLPPGEYKVAFTDGQRVYQSAYYGDVFESELATTVTLTNGQRLTGIDASLFATGAISGTLRLFDGSWFDSYGVTAYRYDGESWEPYTGASNDSIRAGDVISYTIRNLEAGVYRVEGRGSSYGYGHSGFYGGTTVETAVDITVGVSSTVTGIDMTLGADTNNAELTGVVRVDSKPEAGIELALIRGFCPAWGTSGALLRMMTAADGSYAFRALGRGEYCLKLTYHVLGNDPLPPPPDEQVEKYYPVTLTEDDSRVELPIALDSQEWASRAYLPSVHK